MHITLSALKLFFNFNINYTTLYILTAIALVSLLETSDTPAARKWREDGTTKWFEYVLIATATSDLLSGFLLLGMYYSVYGIYNWYFNETK